MDDTELREKVKTIQSFTRMFPDAKLRIVNALKVNNEVVAMIGDGVNDGPALKAFHSGIAMEKKEQKSLRMYFLSINNGNAF